MRRRVLVLTLVRREAGAKLVLGLLASAAAGVLAAAAAIELRDPDVSVNLMRRFLARFDLTLLGAVTVLAVLRVATRIEDDHRTAWLDPYCAGGGCRTAYGVAAAASAATAFWLVFVTGTVGFCAGLLALDGNTELLRGLPVLLAGGALLIAMHAMYIAVVALVFRDTVAALFVAATLMLAPWVVGFLYIRHAGADAVPMVVKLWAASYPPPLQPPQSAVGMAFAVIYIAVGAAVAGAVARRFAGRRP